MTGFDLLGGVAGTAGDVGVVHTSEGELVISLACWAAVGSLRWIWRSMLMIWLRLSPRSSRMIAGMYSCSASTADQ